MGAIRSGRNSMRSVDSRPGELEYDRALAAAKRLDAKVALVVAASGGRPEGDWPF